MRLRTILAGIGLLLLIFVLLNLGTYATDAPDLSTPPHISHSGQSTTSVSAQTVSAGNPLGAFQAIASLMSSLVIIIIVLAVLGIGAYSLNRVGLFSAPQQDKKQQQDVGRINDAREEAYRILKHALETQQYTAAYVEAYRALDVALESFREISRPKHWTPKEYAYTVSKPVFRPSVYTFVSKFYDIVYGTSQAEREDIFLFIQSLDRLFEEDIPIEERKMKEEEFKSKVKITEFKLPNEFDLNRPKGRL